MSTEYSVKMSIQEINKINEGGDKLVADVVDLITLDWYEISRLNLTEKAMIEFKDYIDWEVVFENNNTDFDKISIETCHTLANFFQNSYIIGSMILQCKVVDEQFVRQYVDKLDEDDITMMCVLRKGTLVSDQFLIDFADRLDWSEICSERPLTEDFMRVHKDKLDWYDVSRKQELSEEFILEMKDYVKMTDIVPRGILSSDFISQHFEMFDCTKLLYRFYPTVSKVKEKYDAIIEEENMIEAERIADLQRRMSGLTIDELLSKFTEYELRVARQSYKREKLVRLDNQCKIVGMCDDYIRIHRASPGEIFELFLFRIYKMREHFEFFNPLKSNPELDGGTQMDSFLKDLEKHNH